MESIILNLINKDKFGGNMEKLEVLKEVFGFSSFREGQEDLIDNILNGRDTLGIMPTGAGKSMCYQLPALMLEGITLVVSPLISLMKDQVNSLIEQGINAAYLNSSLSISQFNKVLDNARENKYKIIYIAPERLLTDEFLSFIQAVKVSMITIDEAHCVSQWGQDFRPSYLRILNFINRFNERPIVSAFTATATSQVKEDIIEQLGLYNPYVLTTGFDRKNLYFSVEKPVDKFSTLLEYINKNKQKCGIVYCSTRKTVDEVCRKLNEVGLNATKYHSGLSDDERRENQDAFIYDKCNIIVATNAFGMGIDKSNVSFVIHYNMPKNIESYYQEAGRAGRDGEPADCILLYGGQDVITNQFLIDQPNGNEMLDEETMLAVKEKDRELLRIMTYYCHTKECLRAYILNYFGEETSGSCGNCSSCNTEFNLEDITVEAQKILSCIIRANERFGIKMIIDILRGSKGQRLLSYNLNKLSTYGIMSGVSEKKIREIINFLILEEYIYITKDQFPVIKCTKKASEILFDGKRVNMKVNKLEESSKGSWLSKSKPMDTQIDDGLFELLRALRNKIATATHVPAYIVFADAALRDMCIKMPTNDEEFLLVSGVGQAKLLKYGKDFIGAINEYKQNNV